MGNEVGKTQSRMGIAAMAAVTKIDRNEISALQRKFREASQRSGAVDIITRFDFDEIIRTMENLESSDAELLDRLFTMFDTSGDSQIDYRDFIVGIAPLINGSILDRLKFAFQLYDVENIGTVQMGEMKRVLTAINNVASYFGDPVVTSDQIEEVTVDVFKRSSNPAAPLRYQEHMQFLSEHPIVILFATGKGTERFGR